MYIYEFVLQILQCPLSLPVILAFKMLIEGYVITVRELWSQLDGYYRLNHDRSWCCKLYYEWHTLLHHCWCSGRFDSYRCDCPHVSALTCTCMALLSNLLSHSSSLHWHYRIVVVAFMMKVRKGRRATQTGFQVDASQSRPFSIQSEAVNPLAGLDDHDNEDWMATRVETVMLIEKCVAFCMLRKHI